MIVSLTGLVRRAVGTSAVIDVAGVGYLVNVTPAHALALTIGEETTIHTVQVVREDSLTLFGFASTEEQDVFELLISVTGVGPKSALGILSALSPAEVAAAVAAEDDSAFRRVSGIGPKTAKLIAVSLAGKLVALPASGGVVAPSSVSDAVVAALSGLGWAEKLAVEAVELARDVADEATAQSVPALLRLALTQLGAAR
ncbi:MAG TPA: Holliday junction branch migration protein RuvA [Microbacteriaceae bacterium]|nr:Holliday junction branch migration protein RuvA [Microbacteriaceae bacterium]